MKNEENAIEVRDVTKTFKVYYDKGTELKEKLLFWKRNRYENRVVLDHISFEVKKGEAIGLVGKNGCGKTTTMNIVSNIIPKDSGEINFGKENCKIGYLPETPSMFTYMNGYEYLDYIASCCSYKDDKKKRIDEVINIVGMAICADQLYNDKRMIVDNVWSIITIIVVCIVVFMGTVCNIVVLENYLNVKKIENEKNLQISEMSLQYDYYMKQSNDMENIRKISHDIKNHLEALRGNVDYQQKQEYIDGIESKLDIYQSYYKTGNAFLDNLLHAKRLEALEKKIEFKVFADFTPFKRVKNEDLCVIVSNTIDNALRECQLMKADNPKIECLVQLKARKIKGFLSIICENSLRESQAEALRGNSVMETSKEDKKKHGFGVKNIKRVVREYGGEVSFNVVDDMFSVSILIPIEV